MKTSLTKFCKNYSLAKTTVFNRCKKLGIDTSEGVCPTDCDRLLHEFNLIFTEPESDKAILSQFKTPPVEAFDTLRDTAKIIEFWNQKAQQRAALNQPSETTGIAVADLAPLPTPQFSIGDRVCWSPLPGEAEEPLEGGYVIGMKYWTPNFSEPSVSLEGTNAEWQYLIYLNATASSRAWIQTDWAAESDLVFQEPRNSRSPVTEPEGIEA
ncbi:MAG: hypothetical protein DCF22_24630 [Leptolyngbya sp.]|nr:MAG: hypothetical protein DCF22_24630 [Leptolyngbya sp.]